MATELGQAYVQIMPSAKGIKGSIEKQLSGEATSAGKSAGNSIMGGIKGAIVKAGIGVAIAKTITDSIKAGGALEQSIGGIETLFKDQAEAVRKSANEAYKTVGVSANDYMENVTSFSASLLQSMGGDTKEAAKVAHTAMVDMGDNANKLGTDMRDIQNAYGGFAKNNYTMLDNLKLGYAGTKGEMERLLKDATKLTGVKYDISNLDDVFIAVHAIQEELGITGTTALEAEETIQGSFSAMKSAFTNFLGALAIGENLKGSLNALAETLSTFLIGNLLPMIGNILKALPESIVVFFQAAAPNFLEAGGRLIEQISTGVTEGLPNLVTTLGTMVTNIINTISEKLPQFLESGVEIITNIINGIMQVRPLIIESAGNIISTFTEFLMTNAPKILAVGKDLILNLVDGIINNLPAIADSAIQAVSNFIDTIVANYPEYLKTGWAVLGELIAGIIDRLPEIITAAVTIMAKFVEMLISKIPDVLNAGKDIVRGLWDGILEMKDWVIEKIKGFASDIAQSFKDFFGIESPSTLMASFGQYISQGLAQGITENEHMPLDAITSIAEKMADAARDAVSSTRSILNSVNVQSDLSHAAKVARKNRGTYDDYYSGPTKSLQIDYDGNQRINDKSTTINQTNNIYSPTPLNPSEVARQVRNVSQKLALGLLR